MIARHTVRCACALLIAGWSIPALAGEWTHIALVCGEVKVSRRTRSAGLMGVSSGAAPRVRIERQGSVVLVEISDVVVPGLPRARP